MFGVTAEHPASHTSLMLSNTPCPVPRADTADNGEDDTNSMQIKQTERPGSELSDMIILSLELRSGFWFVFSLHGESHLGD